MPETLTGQPDNIGPEVGGVFGTNADAVDFFETAREGRRAKFELDPRVDRIGADDLRALLRFPFEISLYERGGRIGVFTTAQPESTLIPLGRRDALTTSLVAHTHPETDGKVYAYMSLGDILSSTTYFGPNTQQFLITDQGLVVYRRPQFDPVQGSPTDDSARVVISRWGRDRGIGFYQEPDLQRFGDLADDKQVQLMKDFADATGMIVKDVRWGEEEGVAEIIDAINLTKVISDNRAPVISS